MSVQRLKKNKKVIFFDLNGTLIHKKNNSAEAFSEALSPYLARWDAEDKSALIHKASKIYSHAIRQYRKKQLEITEKKRKAAIKRAIASLPLSPDERVLMAIDQALVTAMNRRSNIDPQTLSLLKRLKKRYRLAVITNGKEPAVQALLKRHQLGKFFPPRTVIVSSRLGKGKGKPHPAIFHYALARMQVRPEQALMVGNSWRHDVEGAVQCGIDAVWINPSNKPIPRRVNIESVITASELSDLRDIL